MFNKREKSIIYELLDEKVSVQELSKKHDVSVRTIQRDMNNIGIHLDKFNIDLVNNNGLIELNLKDSNNRVKLIAYIEKHESDNLIYTMFYYMLQNNNVKISDLSEEFFFSESYLTSKIRELRKDLKEYNLDIESDYNSGLKVIGDESDIRKYIFDNMIIFSNNLLLTTLFNHIDMEDINKVKEIIIKELSHKDMMFSDIDLTNILALTIVSISRNDLGSKSRKTIENKSIVDRLVNRINKELNYNLDQYDSDYILRNSILKFQENENFDEDINYIVSNSIEEITALKKDYYKFDGQFFQSFIKHIELILKRSLTMEKISNPLLNELKINYFIEFNDAMIVAKYIQKRMGIEITEDETGYLAIHLGSSRRMNFSNNTAIIICNYGIGTSRILKLKIEKDYPDIEVLGVYPASYIDTVILQKPDYIITTTDINRSTDIPIIDAKNYLFKNIRLDFSNKKDNNIKNLLKPKLFFNVSVKDKEDFFIKSREIFKNINVIDMKIVDTAIAHEKSNPTDMGNNIAIPHVVASGEFDSFIAIFKLKESIKWSSNHVDYVFLIVINENEKRYIDSLSYFYNYVFDEKNLESMQESKTFDEFTKDLLGGNNG